MAPRLSPPISGILQVGNWRKVALELKRCLWQAGDVFPNRYHLLMGQIQSRTQEIQSARADKMAHLWPERESPLVQQVNQLVERGLLEGAQTGMGANGWQVVLGGKNAAKFATVF